MSAHTTEGPKNGTGEVRGAIYPEAEHSQKPSQPPPLRVAGRPILAAMMHTVRLCRDLSGWFATMSDDLPHYPGARVHWAAAFDDPDHAMQVLDLTQALAVRMADDGVTWTPGRAPSWT